jgi:hypothetical protein
VVFTDVQHLNDRLVALCHLSICGATRSDVGESFFGKTTRQGDTYVEENAATSAIAQAFKRACVKYGMGTYLYRIPPVWADYNPQGRRFTDDGIQALVDSAMSPATAYWMQCFPGIEHGTVPPDKAVAAERWAVARGGDHEQYQEALKIYRWYAPLLHLDTHVKLVQYIKLAMAETGMGSEMVRAPRLPLVGDEREDILAIIRQSIRTRPTQYAH